MIRKSFYAAILALGFFGLALPSHAQQTHYDVVPLPRHIELKQDPLTSSAIKAFVMYPNTEICYQKGANNLKREAQFLAAYIKQINGVELKLTTKQ